VRVSLGRHKIIDNIAAISGLVKNLLGVDRVSQGVELPRHCLGDVCWHHHRRATKRQIEECYR